MNRLKTFFRGGMLVASVSWLASPVAASVVQFKAAGSHVKGAVKPDLNYFKGKTITLVSDSGVGGATDLLFREIAPYLGGYLHATVDVEDSPNGNAISGQDLAAAAKPDGLTIGYLNLNSDIEDQATKVPGVDFPLKTVEPLVGAGGPDSGIISNPVTGPTTIKSFLDSTTPVSILQNTTGSFTLQVDILLAAYNATNVHVVTGYNSSAALVSGFERGDGPVTGTALGNIMPLVQAGLARPLLVTSPPPPGTLDIAALKGVPTLSELAKEDPPKTKSGRKALQDEVTLETGSSGIDFVPAGTPKKYQLALSEALVHTYRLAPVKAFEATQGDSSTVATAGGCTRLIEARLALEPFIATYLAEQ